MKAGGHKLKGTIRYAGAAALTALLPWIIDALMLGYLGHGIFDVVPYFNDEVNYWHLIYDMLEYGQPIGYMGFYGTHAPVGTFGFHGFVILLPYYLFARIFGLHFYTLAVCNMVLVSGGLLFWIWQLRPSVKTMLLTGGLVTLPSMVSKFYSTSMLEGLNVFLALVFAALFIRILDTGKRRYQIAAWAVMAFAILAKVTWVICVLPLAMVCLKGNLWRRAGWTAGIMAAVSLAGYKIYSLFSAPYYQSKFNDFRDAFAQEGLARGAWLMARETVYDFFRPMLIALRGQDGEGSLEVWNGILLYGMFLLLTVMVLRLLWLWFRYRQEIWLHTAFSRRQVILTAAAWTVMAVDLAGIAVLYMPAQTIRTAFHSYLFAVILLSEWRPSAVSGTVERREEGGSPVSLDGEQREAGRARLSRMITGVKLAFLAASAASTATLCVTGDGFGDKLYLSQSFLEEYEETKAFLSQYIQLDENQVGWRNTVAYMEGVPEIYWMCMPAGTGLNYHVWLSDSYEEQWAVMEIEQDGVYDFETVYTSFTDAGYEEIARDDRIILFSAGG